MPWCFQSVVLEKTLESPLDCKEIKPVNSKGNQPWIFTGRTNAEAPILWPPDSKSWLIRKDPDAGKDWGQEKRATEEEMAGQHHQLSEHELEQIRRAAVYGVIKSQTRLSNWTTTTTKIPHATEQRSPWATATKPAQCNFLKPAHLEPVLCHKRSHSNEKPIQHR